MAGEAHDRINSPLEFMPTRNSFPTFGLCMEGITRVLVCDDVHGGRGASAHEISGDSIEVAHYLCMQESM